jgi:Cft2 family RNA processing exonuclease
MIVRFLVRLSNQDRASAADRKQLTRRAYESVRKLGGDIGNLRVTSTAIELDLLLESENGLQSAVKALENEVGPMLTLRKLQFESPVSDKREAVKAGVGLFNQERYWESHEALESAWKMADGDEKEILQGLILVAAALVHWQKNEKEVTLSVLKRARDKLATHETDYSGIDLKSLTDKIEKMLEANEPEFFKLVESNTNP